ncbi:MAG: glycosyltransferase family 2 protein [Marinovum sp.]|nr:glycosyltransferase family 2 protein [Marinovum sp.]
MTRWGLVSTIKAAPDDVLAFAAYHLELGAHRLYIYLDAPNDALPQLRAHPQIKAVETDDPWWAKRKGKPEKHQSRQFANARHAYNRKVEVDWLAHIDADEFLAPGALSISNTLGSLSTEALCARVRPVEALADGDGLWKAFHLDHRARRLATNALYPTYAPYLNAGFISHIAGKLFYRTGIDGLKAKIHNVQVHGQENPGEVHLKDIDLCHLHARNWDSWLSHFKYRHAKGSYRPELKGRGPISPHALFAEIMESEGDAGLRAFFDKVLAATPTHIAALEYQGLLRRHDLHLDAVRKKHFGSG